MPALPLVSVVIPAYNRAQVICEAVDSVFSQTYRDFEVIVVDDGSTDSTEVALARYQNQIRIVRRSANAGPGRARNDGIAASTGDLVCFLDSDDIYLPMRLQVAVDLLQAHPEYGAVYSDMLVEFSEGGPRVPWVRSQGPVPTGRIFPELLQTAVYGLSSMLTLTVRRAVIERAGGFDESLRYGEDREFWWRVARESLMGYIDQATCVCRPRPRIPPTGSRATADWVRATGKVLASYPCLAPRERHLALLLHCSNLRIHGMRLAAEGKRMEALRAWSAAAALAVRRGLLVSAAKTVLACALGGTGQTVIRRAGALAERRRRGLPNSATRMHHHG